MCGDTTGMKFTLLYERTEEYSGASQPEEETFQSLKEADKRGQELVNCESITEYSIDDEFSNEVSYFFMVIEKEEKPTFKYQIIFENNGNHCIYDIFDSRGEAEQAMQELKDNSVEHGLKAFDVWIHEAKENT